MRPKKMRWVQYNPGDRRFIPRCKKNKRVEEVVVTLDEFEALRLADLNGMRQETAAKMLKISRPTFSRIIESARKKVADGLVNIKMIRIEGGCCEIAPPTKGLKEGN
ncbi:MAG: DUF134 domain-containing protein [Candidatus Omnitrophica bacterium]|nr:DUF134 domain-containing protein [Candidatus Omnitrophota bacterium]MCM8791122.1 DUF134 domain-containing protein [Candidatus Omnitrophota bacterium]